ncbi:hypothetical protein [Paenibacillus glacialis]|uniref:Inosine/uridine-preferring nucleoside hydrolase domain-containing protein n=1 Tax=Paenibacillus glacialis TaxID=494026 RepID=A0A162PPF1_9BACL|nr:hypothetical protein [Paenibacillus glacialis]OAB33860.1 hypothetical protein PGLA_23340 [Paenibacillus glacialis]
MNKFIKLLMVVILTSVISPFSLYPSSVFADNKIIYSTDLFNDGDFDDYFDLIALKSLEGIDSTIILDGNEQITTRGGASAIENLDIITGETTKYTLGLNENSYFYKDRGWKSHSFLQRNIQNIISEIQQAPEKTTIVTVGSLRDISAAYNREPNLFREKVSKIYIFAGDYKGTYKEHNVELDELAYLNVMNSGLSIFWIPCFEEGLWTYGDNSSYFTVKHSELFTNSESPLFKWFLYRFIKETIPFESFLNNEYNGTLFLEDMRNLWVAPLLSILDGGWDSYIDKYNLENNTALSSPITFEPVTAKFLKEGKVDYTQGNKIMKLKIVDRDEYVSLSKYIIKEMIKRVEGM